MHLVYFPDCSVSRATAALFCIFILLLPAACDKVPLTAPTQSRITLTVSTTTLPVSGTAQVIATVIEQAGTPVQNGTLVTFTMSGTPSTPQVPGNQTALGPNQIPPPMGFTSRTSATRNETFNTGGVGSFDPPEALTTNGRAITTFRAGTLSGIVNIGAASGGAVASSIEVSVGGAAAGQVVVRAEPSSVPVTGGSVQVIAVVIDASGNPLPGAPVVFSSDNGSLSSNSAISDVNGEARVTLTTNRDTTVRATVGARTGQTAVRAVALPTVGLAVAAGTVPEAGIPTTFTVTPAAAANGNPLRSVVIDFGDFSQENLGPISGQTNVAHTYARSGQYRVTATVTDVEGLTSTATLVIQVNDRSTMAVTLTATPGLGGLVEFTATATPPTGASIRVYEWDFGDGRTAETTGGATSHRYTTGTYTARVTVRATNGQVGFAERAVVIP
jgi:PKD repeat protein